MEVYENLKFNNITVLSTDIFNINGKKYYKCKCDCDNEKYIQEATIRTRRIRDCGCGEFARKRLIGKKFGRLLVVDANRDNKTNKKNIMCICQCECGNIRNIPASALKRRKSCGCIQKLDFSKYKGKKYGNITIIDIVDENNKIIKCKCSCGNIFETKLYYITNKNHKIISCGKCGNKYNYSKPSERQRLSAVLRNMIDRCYNESAKDYKWYGARGIKVCDDWINSANSFIDWSISNGYKKGLSIDRINNNIGYYPNNCRWVTIKDQQNNRRNNVRYNFNNQLMTLPQIAEKVKINYNTIRSRLRKGMSFEESINTPLMRRR